MWVQYEARSDLTIGLGAPLAESVSVATVDASCLLGHIGPLFPLAKHFLVEPQEDALAPDIDGRKPTPAPRLRGKLDARVDRPAVGEGFV